jgi:hypothetical protein
MKDNFETLKMLLEKHTTELDNRRKKIHSTTEKYITLVFVIFAWLTSQKESLTFNNKFLFALIVLFIMIVAIVMLYNDNKVYLEHAKIVNKISKQFGVFEEGRLIDSETIYPENWKNFGIEKKIKGVIMHYTIILLLTSAIIITIYQV